LTFGGLAAELAQQLLLHGQTADFGARDARPASGGCECIHGNAGHALAPSLDAQQKGDEGQGKQKRLGSSFANQTVS